MDVLWFDVYYDGRTGQIPCFKQHLWHRTEYFWIDVSLRYDTGISIEEEHR